MQKVYALSELHSEKNLELATRLLHHCPPFSSPPSLPWSPVQSWCLLSEISHPESFPFFSSFPFQVLLILFSFFFSLSHSSAWRNEAQASQISLPRLVDMDWRVDIKTSSDTINRMAVPTCLLQLKIQEDAALCRNSPVVSALTVELSKETLDTMLEGLGRIRDQLSAVANKWTPSNVNSSSQEGKYSVPTALLSCSLL